MKAKKPWRIDWLHLIYIVSKKLTSFNQFVTEKACGFIGLKPNHIHKECKWDLYVT